MESLKKNDTKALLYKRETESLTQKTNLWSPVGGGINWEIGTDTYTLLYIKQITNKDLLYMTGNSTQYSVMAYMGEKFKKEWLYMYA